MTSFLYKKLKELNKMYQSATNEGGELEVMGSVFMHDLEAFLTQTIKECQQKTRKEMNKNYDLLLSHLDSFKTLSINDEKNRSSRESNLAYVIIRLTWIIQSLKETEGKE